MILKGQTQYDNGRKYILLNEHLFRQPYPDLIQFFEKILFNDKYCALQWVCLPSYWSKPLQISNHFLLLKALCISSIGRSAVYIL